MEEKSDYLIHYGVLGMKWGVRKDRRKSTKVRKTARKEASKAASEISKNKTSGVTLKEIGKTAKSLVTDLNTKRTVRSEIKRSVKQAKAEAKAERKKKVKDLSDEELKQRINRLEMEKQYKSLKQNQLSEGTKLVQNILKKSGENIGTQLATYGLGTAVNKLLKAEIVNPKKGQKDK